MEKREILDAADTYCRTIFTKILKVSRGNGLNLHLETLIIGFKMSLASKQILTTL